MAGNRNSGRRPAPPSPEDAFSEELIDVQGQIVAIHGAVVHLITRWRDLRGLYPDPQPTHHLKAA